MSRRLPLSLRAWSGALLVCALFACLTGLARPAMAMAMPVSPAVAEPSAGPAAGRMKMAVAAMVTGHPAAPSSAAAPDRDPRCPHAAEQCVSPKGVLAQDVSAGRTDAPSRPMACAPSLLPAQPNAPPPTEAPPDLHRLCVSRT